MKGQYVVSQIRQQIATFRNLAFTKNCTQDKKRTLVPYESLKVSVRSVKMNILLDGAITAKVKLT